MQSGYFVHFTNIYRTSWIWLVIILAFQQILVLESGQKNNLFLNLLFWIFIAFLFYLIWPRRFMFIENSFYFTKLFSAKLVEVDLRYVSGVHTGKYTFQFNYAGKYYRFLSVGNGLNLLKDRFQKADLLESVVASESE
ncbi:hypothetical protein [Lactovum miscens]|uniref:Signal transduction histidine kinase n=1 Tax=Lactovum miscens TaxID=190387 RepID=A0A841C8H4_9LACT|nr:hypothetical protein [Lactovum miscens]MBB5887882.1 signal transduction histidine kinase [Lactovum miscens]